MTKTYVNSGGDGPKPVDNKWAFARKKPCETLPNQLGDEQQTTDSIVELKKWPEHENGIIKNDAATDNSSNKDDVKIQSTTIAKNIKGNLSVPVEVTIKRKKLDVE